MDQSCWLYQMAHLSTWFRCIAIDIPGYGRSPKASAGLALEDIAEACWDAIDRAFPGDTAILVGSSVGSMIVPCMHDRRPDRSSALDLCGRSEEHTYELQSLMRISYAVFCLKKNKLQSKHKEHLTQTYLDYFY